MERQEYDRMFKLEDTYWYFRGRRSIIGGLLQKYLNINAKPLRILDVGCGTGLMLEHLQGRNQKPVGLDSHELSMIYCRKRGVERLTRGDVTRLPFADNSFDLIMALDMMEHVEDDRALLSEFHRVAAPGARIMLTVPAHPFLWSEHDEALHHYRRYQRKPLLNLLKESGFRPIRYSYAISILFLPIVAFRIAQRLLKSKDQPKTDLIELPAPINRLLLDLLRLEGAVLRKINIPFGVTLLALLELDTE